MTALNVLSSLSFPTADCSLRLTTRSVAWPPAEDGSSVRLTWASAVKAGSLPSPAAYVENFPYWIFLHMEHSNKEGSIGWWDQRHWEDYFNIGPQDILSSQRSGLWQDPARSDFPAWFLFFLFPATLCFVSVFQKWAYRLQSGPAMGLFSWNLGFWFPWGSIHKCQNS